VRLVTFGVTDDAAAVVLQDIHSDNGPLSEQVGQVNVKQEFPGVYTEEYNL